MQSRCRCVLLRNGRREQARRQPERLLEDAEGTFDLAADRRRRQVQALLHRKRGEWAARMAVVHDAVGGLRLVLVSPSR